MSLIGVFSLKGAPGVTTTAMALGATWLGWQRALVADLDASGGDLGPRFGLPTEPPSPGLASLAVEARRSGADPELVWRHAAALSEGLEVLVAPTSPAQAHATLSALSCAYGPALKAVAEDPDTVVIADFGRLTPGNPALAFAALADAHLLVARPQVNDLLHVAPAVPELKRVLKGLGLVLAGRGDAEEEEVTRLTGLPLFGAIPRDPVGAGLLMGEPGRWRRALRRPLVRAVQQVGSAVEEQMRPYRRRDHIDDKAKPSVRVLPRRPRGDTDRPADARGPVRRARIAGVS